MLSSKTIGGEARAKLIIEIVKEKNGESVRELSKLLGVTEMTIRRDVQKLQAASLIKMVSGAVVYTGSDFEEQALDTYDLLVQKTKRIQEKFNIGKLAASLIENDDIIYIDVGTTTSRIVEHISTDRKIRAVCCTMNTLMEIQKKGIQNIIMIGGTYIPELQMFESKEGVELLERTRISKAFMSAAGVTAKLGVTCINNCEVNTKTAAMQSALKKILVVDSSKFDVVKPAFFAEIADFDAIVSDRGLPAEWKERIELMGIDLYLA